MVLLWLAGELIVGHIEHEGSSSPAQARQGNTLAQVLGEHGVLPPGLVALPVKAHLADSHRLCSRPGQSSRSLWALRYSAVPDSTRSVNVSRGSGKAGRLTVTPTAYRSRPEDTGACSQMAWLQMGYTGSMSGDLLTERLRGNGCGWSSKSRTAQFSI